MAQVDQAALHNFVNGETVTDQMLDQNFEIVRVAQNETDTKTATHKNSVILDHPDKSVTTAKLADKAVTFDKLGVDLQASLDLEKEWTATANQTVFDLSDVGTYPVGVHAIEFIIGGVPQSESAYIQSSPTTITTVEGVAAGVKVRAKWRMGLMPTTTVGHQSTHQQGGLDELDITTLKNYQPLIADKLGNLSKKISFYDLKVDFGAVGDGVTDDSAALQLARDTMNSLSNGGTLFIPAGRYISRTAGKWLITNPNVFIGGQSKKSSIIDANNDLNFSFNIRANGVTLYD